MVNREYWNYETKKKVVMNDKSEVYQNWKQLVPSLTKEEFLENLKWVCEDPGDPDRAHTREIGLERNGIVKLERVRVYVNPDMYLLRTLQRAPLGQREWWWNGDIFRVPATDEEREFFGEDITTIQATLCISRSSRI